MKLYKAVNFNEADVDEKFGGRLVNVMREREGRKDIIIDHHVIGEPRFENRVTIYQ